MSPQHSPIHVIGGGLAGCEAAFQIASKHIPVILHEMRPQRMTDAHQTQGLAELVCSNSFRSDDSTANAVGVLHEEMRQLGSLIIRWLIKKKYLLAGRWRSIVSGFQRLLKRLLRRIRSLRLNVKKSPHSR